LSAARRLRISGGIRRGLGIQAPTTIRPTSGRLREALFNLWAGRLEGCRFLDLFAGSGAVGIEAASRGAQRVLLVEGDRKVVALLERNRLRADLAGVELLYARLPGELGRCLPPEERFDLVFADPPYGFEGFTPLLEEVQPYLAADGEIGLEHPWRDGEPACPDGLEAFRSRRYGDSGLTRYRRAAEL
jgi:16S rRNA (guanine966-N2)-methyltransferase